MASQLPRRARAGLCVLAAIAVGGVAGGVFTAEAATLTGDWDVGYDAPIQVNGYGLQGAGLFELDTAPAGSPPNVVRAFCLEAQTPHLVIPDAYQLVPNTITSAQVDFLAFLLTPHSEFVWTDAAAAGGQFATWYYAGATRSAPPGVPVWADGSNGFAPISPVSPDPWNALPSLDPVTYPIGVQTGAGAVVDTALEIATYDMYQLAQANRGPWTMDPITYDRAAATASTVIRNATGAPISYRKNWRWIVTDDGGAEVQNVVVSNSAAGVISLSGIPALVDGGTIRLQGWAPGVHQEWDEAPGFNTQRMLTGTPVELARDLDVDPLDRWVRVIKTSTDATISVAGTVLALLDGSGDEIDRVTVGADGVGNFTGFNPDVYEPPYRIREIAAAPGLEPLTADVPIPGPPVAPPLSTDPDNPTQVTIANRPHAERLVVQKLVSGAAGAPSNLSGFQFTVTRVADGQDFGTYATSSDGATPTITVTTGEYIVAEVARPSWWPAGDPLPSPMLVTVPPNGTGTVTVDYTNVLPTPTIVTSAADQADADRYVPPSGGTVTDTVSYSGVVAGTEYTVSGELMLLNGDGTTTPSGVVGSTTFTPSDASGAVDVTFDVPAGSALAGGGVGVVFERLAITSTGTVVATHRDVTDLAQTVYFPTIATAAADPVDGDRYLPTEGGTVVDRVSYTGLMVGSEYTVSGELMLRDDDGTTTSTGIVGSTTFTPAAASGTVDVTFDVPPGSAFAGGGVGVVFERLAVTASGAIIAIHEDPDDISQTVRFPTIATSATDQADGDRLLEPAAGGTIVDVVAYSGLDPAVEYTVSGELMLLDGDGATTSTGIVGSTTFTPAEASGAVEVTFVVPPGSPLADGGVGVVFEQLAVTATGTVVATHRDPTDLLQTVYFPTIATSLSVPQSTATGEAARFAGADTPLVDTVSYAGLPAGRYRAELTVYQRGQAGACTATPVTVHTEVTLTALAGSFEVGPFVLDRVGGTFVAFEELFLLTEQPDGSVVDTLVATHADCGDMNQTVHSIGIESVVARPNPVGSGTQTDELVVFGLVDGLPAGATAIAEVNLHRHPEGTPLGRRVCDASNLADSSRVTVVGDGTYRSPGESFGLGTWSYSNRVVITFADGTRHVSDWHGCNVASESFVASANRTTTSTGTGLTLPLTAGASLFVGAGLLLGLAARRRPAPGA